MKISLRTIIFASSSILIGYAFIFPQVFAQTTQTQQTQCTQITQDSQGSQVTQVSACMATQDTTISTQCTQVTQDTQGSQVTQVGECTGTQGTQSTLGVAINPGILSIAFTPRDFNFAPVNITSPTASYTATYTNPVVADPDNNPATRDGTALQITDGRFKGGFELQAQVDQDFCSVNRANPSDPCTGNTIPATNLLIDYCTNLSIQETSAQGTVGTHPPSCGYQPMNPSPLVLLDGSTDCSHGRTGLYSSYPNFQLTIPNSTPAGTYTNTITYSVVEQPSNCP